jgi:hypothetical protein
MKINSKKLGTVSHGNMVKRGKDVKKRRFGQKNKRVPGTKQEMDQVKLCKMAVENRNRNGRMLAESEVKQSN